MALRKVDACEMGGTVREGGGEGEGRGGRRKMNGIRCGSRSRWKVEGK